MPLALLPVLVFAVLPGAYADETLAENTEDEQAVEDTELTEDGEDGSADGETKKKWYQGSIRLGFDGIWSRNDRDIEMDQFLRFQLNPPDHERLQLRGAVWLIEKLDPPSARRGALRDLNDTFSERVITRISSLYLDVNDLWGDSVLRLGRQRIIEGAAYNLIDGVYFKQRQSQWDWYVFGGSRATFYGDNFEHPLFGAGVSVSPTSRTRIALDAYAGREKQYEGRRITLRGPVAAMYYRLTTKQHDTHVNSASMALSVWHTINASLALFGRFNWYDDRGEEIWLSAAGHVPLPFDITYEIAYRRQFNSIGDRTSDISGYYRLMGVYEGYDNVFLAAYRPITQKVMLSLETELHWTRSSNWANRDYQRYAAYVLGEKLFDEAAIDARVGLERWNVSEGAASWAVVGEIGRRWDAVQITFGVDYQRYKDRVTEYNETMHWLDMARVWFSPGRFQGYNPLMLIFNSYTVEMQENIYTVYLRGRWRIAENQELSAKITYEEGDRPETPYWRIQADYTYRF